MLLSEKVEVFFWECSFLEVFICYFPTKSSSKCLFVGIFGFQVFLFSDKRELFMLFCRKNLSLEF